ncbi:tetratricopeptide repeat-containing sulfotransferase family protein [Croceicoccus pelagius]|nr:sulfotransferase [Croceicoccus pelagius]
MMASVAAFPGLAQAQALLDEQRPEQAAQAIMAHLRQHKDEPRGLAMLGQTAAMIGALGQAEHFMRKALATGYDTPELRSAFITVLLRREKVPEALALLEKAIEQGGEDNFRTLYSGVLTKIGRSDEALELQQELAAADPKNPQHQIALGHNLRAAGRVDEAVETFRKAIALAEGAGDAWWALASIRKKVLTDDEVMQLKRLVAHAREDRNAASVHFALARALHERSDYEGAFAHYEKGNWLRAESIGYDAAELREEVAQTRQIATAQCIAAFPDAPVGDVTPVFIVSLPRSGSTLLEQMLGSHHQIEAVGELQYVPAILRAMLEAATMRQKMTVPQLVASLTDHQAQAMGQDYLRRAALHRQSANPFFIDKLPHNWSNVFLIRRILPQAKIIDIRRPAMDCCFANFTQSFTDAHSSSFALEHIGRTYVDYVDYMAHFDEAAPGLVHHIDYTHLIEEPEPILRAALDHVGVEWDPAVLEYHKLERSVRTPSSEQVRRPLNRDGMAVWKPYSKWLDPLREALGSLAEG